MQKIAFLDRDGVINIDKKYIYKISDFEFIDGIFEFCKFLRENQYKIVIITNQSGIARGYYTEKDYLVLTKWIKDKFNEKMIKIESIIHCPYHPRGIIKRYKRDSSLRKPKPGMIYLIERKINIDKEKSFIIGDKKRQQERSIFINYYS